MTEWQSHLTSDLFLSSSLTSPYKCYTGIHSTHSGWFGGNRVICLQHWYLCPAPREWAVSEARVWALAPNLRAGRDSTIWGRPGGAALVSSCWCNPLGRESPPREGRSAIQPATCTRRRLGHCLAAAGTALCSRRPGPHGQGLRPLGSALRSARASLVADGTMKVTTYGFVGVLQKCVRESNRRFLQETQLAGRGGRRDNHGLYPPQTSAVSSLSIVVCGDRAFCSDFGLTSTRRTCLLGLFHIRFWERRWKSATAPSPACEVWKGSEGFSQFLLCTGGGEFWRGGLGMSRAVNALSCSVCSWCRRERLEELTRVERGGRTIFSLLKAEGPSYFVSCGN